MWSILSTPEAMTLISTREPLILGLGNLLMSDDGLGVHAVRALLRNGVSPDRCLEVGTAVLQAQGYLEEADSVIVIDAIQAGGTPGTIHCLEGCRASLSRRETLHDLSIAGLLRLMPAPKRPRVLIVGVEPERLAYGLDLSETVADAMAALLAMVEHLLKRAADGWAPPRTHFGMQANLLDSGRPQGNQP